MKIDLATLRGLDAHVAADSDLKAHLQELETEANGQAMSTEQLADFQETVEERGKLATVIEQLQIRGAVIRDVLAEGGRGVETPDSRYAGVNVQRRPTPENVYDLSAYRQRVGSVDELPAAYRDGAMRALEMASFPTVVDQDKARAQVERLIVKHKDDDHGIVSRRIIGTSSPAYAEAWARYVTGGWQGVSGQRQAVLQTYSDPDGGVAIPVTIDPTFILTSDGAVNPFRSGYARIETITTKSWSPVTTAGVTAAYVGERTTTGASDSAPTDLDDPTATPVMADVFVKFTSTYEEDYGPAAIAAELGTLIQDSKDVLEADKFSSGSGTNEPEGIVAAIVADTTSLVLTATNDVYALADIDNLIAQLGPRFRSRAKFLANLAILQISRGFGTAGQPAGSIYDPISKILRGYPAGESTAMDDVTTDAKKILLFGDFQRGFVVVDRLGLTTEFVRQVFDTNGKPLAQRGVYARWRNTSKLLFPNAFRLLKVR